MKIKTLFTLMWLSSYFICFSQENLNPLPKYLSPEEIEILNKGQYQAPMDLTKGIPNPPPFPVRSHAEWEELEAIVITWDAFFSTLREIARYASEEVKVINVCNDSLQIKNYLANGGVSNDNLVFVESNFNTVWVRDYGANPAYKNDVDSLVFIDWIYNRPRPLDDVIPDVIGEHYDIPVFSTTEASTDLVNTGGNFMSDGLGNGFSSKLVLNENGPFNQFGTTNQSEEDIDAIMDDYMGIDPYIKMDVLPYDGINHIDMHMKLLDEQTILIGDFPEGISDGPQLEANIQYVLDNYQTHWGTDFKIERIIQPPCGNGNYPPNCSGPYEYRTYTNALFVNKTILVPIYNTIYDQEALDHWQELMPGYNIKGINCTSIINSGGAIHCVTKEIGVKDPLWIAHRELDDVPYDENDTDYLVEAIIKHKSGINNAQLFWTIDTTMGYQEVELSLTNMDEDIWSANIPIQDENTQIFYYLQAEANSGKSIVRPLPAPAGYFDFKVGEEPTNIEELTISGVGLGEVYPNPASAITVIPITSLKSQNAKVTISDILGQEKEVIFEGRINHGESNLFFNASDFPTGTYFVKLESKGEIKTQKIVIQ